MPKTPLCSLPLYRVVYVFKPQNNSKTLAAEPDELRGSLDDTETVVFGPGSDAAEGKLLLLGPGCCA